jgi:hypothetical protein
VVAANNSILAAVLAFAEVKATVEAFERGESNLFDALDRIRVAVSITGYSGGEAQKNAA